MAENNVHSYAEALREAMAEHRPPLTTRDLANATGRSYEQLRRILRGEPVVSEQLHQELSRVLGLSEVTRASLWHRAQLEKIQRRMGDAVAADVDDHPKDALFAVFAQLNGGSRIRLKRLLDLWHLIEAGDQDKLVDVARVWARDPLLRPGQQVVDAPADAQTKRTTVADKKPPGLR